MSLKHSKSISQHFLNCELHAFKIMCDSFPHLHNSIAFLVRSLFFPFLICTELMMMKKNERSERARERERDESGEKMTLQSKAINSCLWWNNFHAPLSPIIISSSSSVGHSSPISIISSSSSSSSKFRGLPPDLLPDFESLSSCCTRLNFVRRFWNQTFTCGIEKECSKSAISMWVIW